MITLNVRYGERTVDVTFPCEEQELHDTLGETAYSLKRGFITEVVEPRELVLLERQTLDLDEINFLAKRMDGFACSDDYEKFIAIAEYEGFNTPQDLINLTYNLDNYTLIQDLRSLEAVGRIYYETTNGAITPNKAETINFAMLGRELLSSGKGTVTEHGIVYENEGLTFDEVYDGQVFPVDYYHGDALLHVKIEYGGKSEVVYLPTENLAIVKALNRLGATPASDITYSLYDFSVDKPEWRERFKDMLRDEDIGEINDLTAAINYADMDLDKLWSLAEYAEAEDAVELANLAKHIDYFTFIKDAQDYEAVGRFMSETYAEYRISEELEPFFDFEKFGEHIADEYHGKFVCGGFVLREPDSSLLDILNHNDATLTMGGI